VQGVPLPQAESGCVPVAGNPEKTGRRWWHRQKRNPEIYIKRCVPSSSRHHENVGQVDGGPCPGRHPRSISGTVYVGRCAQGNLPMAGGGRGIQRW